MWSHGPCSPAVCRAIVVKSWRLWKINISFVPLNWPIIHHGKHSRQSPGRRRGLGSDRIVPPINPCSRSDRDLLGLARHRGSGPYHLCAWTYGASGKNMALWTDLLVVIVRAVVLALDSVVCSSRRRGPRRRHPIFTGLCSYQELETFVS